MTLPTTFYPRHTTIGHTQSNLTQPTLPSPTCTTIRSFLTQPEKIIVPRHKAVHNTKKLCFDCLEIINPLTANQNSVA